MMSKRMVSPKTLSSRRMLCAGSIEGLKKEKSPVVMFPKGCRRASYHSGVRSTSLGSSVNTELSSMVRLEGNEAGKGMRVELDGGGEVVVVVDVVVLNGCNEKVERKVWMRDCGRRRRLRTIRFILRVALSSV